MTIHKTGHHNKSLMPQGLDKAAINYIPVEQAATNAHAASVHTTRQHAHATVPASLADLDKSVS